MLKPLIAARRARGMTQRETGAMINKTQSHYCKIERGESGLSASDALTLCKEFGLDLAELLRPTDQS